MAATPAMNQSVTPELDAGLDTLPVYSLALSLLKFCTPIIIVMGTFGNVMSIVIMSRMTSGESTVNLFFIAIAVGDLLVLYTGSMRQWVEAMFGFFFRDKYPALYYFLFWVASWASTNVSWLLVCVTLQRALSVVWPHHVRRLCTRRRVVAIIAGQTAFLFVLYIHYAYCIPVVISSGQTDVDCMNMASSSDYVWFVNNVFTYVNMVTYSLLPFACLVVGNSVLVSTLVKSMGKAHGNMTSGNSTQVSKREKETYSVTITVLVVSVTFVILTLPITVYFLLFHFKDQRGLSSEEAASVFLFLTVSFLLAGSNSAVNFYLYCLTGRKFREEFVAIVSCKTL